MQFDETFVKPAENVNLYLSTPNFLEAAKSSGMQPSSLVQIRTNLENKPLTFEQCIEWARLKFQDEYSNEIKQLLYSLPKDMVSGFLKAQHPSHKWKHRPDRHTLVPLRKVTKEGTPFWSGPKRAPAPIEFDTENVSDSALQA